MASLEIHFSRTSMQVGHWATTNIAGGVKLEDLTVGFNIYHNPVFRTMFNYVYSDMGGGGAKAMNAFMVRWQIGM